jgi:3-deoxy-D-manno-octulosonic-acid transferase
VAENGAVQVADPAGLEKAIAELLADETRRAELGRNAQRVVRENLGAIDRTVEMILEKLEPREIYIASGI